MAQKLWKSPYSSPVGSTSSVSARWLQIKCFSNVTELLKSRKARLTSSLLLSIQTMQHAGERDSEQKCLADLTSSYERLSYPVFFPLQQTSTSPSGPDALLLQANHCLHVNWRVSFPLPEQAFSTFANTTLPSNFYTSFYFSAWAKG